MTPRRKKATMKKGMKMANIDTDSDIDWSGCVLVAELGSPLEEIHENYPDLSAADIQQLITFAHSHRVHRVP